MHFIEIIICHVFHGYYMSCIPWLSPVFTCIRQNMKWSLLSHALLYREAELFLGIWGAKANNFRGKRKLFSGIFGDQCIIFRDLGSTYHPPPYYFRNFVCLFVCFTSQVNSYGHCGTVSLTNHTFSWASLNKQLTSTLCTYFRL